MALSLHKRGSDYSLQHRVLGGLLGLWLIFAVAIPIARSLDPNAQRWGDRWYTNLPLNDIAWIMFTRGTRQVPVITIRDLRSNRTAPLQAFIGTPSLGYKASRAMVNTIQKQAYLEYLCRTLPPHQTIDIEVWQRQPEPPAPGTPGYRSKRRIRDHCRRS